jgi:hypothetical protein
MLKLLSVFLAIAVVTACSDSNHDVNVQEKLKKDTAVNAQHLVFAAPQIVDSSAIVIYPLVLETKSYEGEYGSRGQETNYWNLVFYNAATQSQHLLTTDKRVLITSLDFTPGVSSSGSSGETWAGINIFKEKIVYTAVATDYNENKQLDKEDPTYLFISDREGFGFRQISPNNYNISSWQVIRGTSKIVLQAQKDDNGDKAFDEHDAAVPMIVDINANQQAVQVFKPGFTDSLKRRLVTIWKQ